MVQGERSPHLTPILSPSQITNLSQEYSDLVIPQNQLISDKSQNSPLLPRPPKKFELTTQLNCPSKKSLNYLEQFKYSPKSSKHPQKSPKIKFSFYSKKKAILVDKKKEIQERRERVERVKKEKASRVERVNKEKAAKKKQSKHVKKGKGRGKGKSNK